MIYDIIHVDTYAEKLPWGSRTLQDVLNNLSAEGWEFVQLLYREKRSDDEIIVKRELRE